MSQITPSNCPSPSPVKAPEAISLTEGSARTAHTEMFPWLEALPVTKEDKVEVQQKEKQETSL